jgi:hypothetical protein
MIDFVQSQLQAADRLFEIMANDHKERLEVIDVWARMNADLIKKLEQRDAIIAQLRAQIQAYETAEVL